MSNNSLGVRKKRPPDDRERLSLPEKGPSPSCKLCATIVTRKMHSLPCGKCKCLFHKRCLKMRPSEYKLWKSSEEEWLCPSCNKQTSAMPRSNQASNDHQGGYSGYRQAMEPTSSSSESEQEGGGTIEVTTIFQAVEDTFSIPFSLTPARISVTPAPNSNSLARDWDTSLYYATRNQPMEETAIIPDPSCVFAPHLTVATQQENDVSRQAVMIPVHGDVPEIEVPSPSMSTQSGFPTHVLSDAPQAMNGSLQEEQQVPPTHENSIRESTTAPEQVPQYPPCASIPNFTIKQTVADDCEEVIWGGMPYNQLLKTIDEFYEKMVFFRKNLFKLPSGKAGK